MKKYGKITAALLALVMVMSLFAACRKDDNNEEETTTEGFTLQLDNGEGEMTEESTTQAESTTEVATEEEKTTKVKVTVKIPSITKAPGTTKVSSSTKAPPATKHEEIDTTVPPTTNPGETLAPNVEKLLGCWEARYEVEGVTIYVQFEFKPDNSVETELTKKCYDKMINEIADRAAFGVTQEQLDSVGVDNATAYKEALLEYLRQELPFDELKKDFKSTGTWELEDDTLRVTIDGETAVSEDGFLETDLIFGLEFADGFHMTFYKWL